MKLFLGDAFDFLSSLEDCSVDMFLTDPLMVLMQK